MVARDTPAKRNDLEQYIVLTMRVPQVITSQELTEIVQLVRQATSVEKIGWDTTSDQIVIRDRLSRAALAQALLSQLISYHPEVMIDLELLQVSDSDMTNYGFTVTNNFPLVYLGGIQNSVASIPSGVTNLLTFGAGYSLMGVAAAQVQAMFNETFSQLEGALLRANTGRAAGRPGHSTRERNIPSSRQDLWLPPPRILRDPPARLMPRHPPSALKIWGWI